MDQTVKLPRLDHLLHHFRRSHGEAAARRAEILLALLTPKTLDEIAVALGPGWTRSQIDYQLMKLLQVVRMHGGPEFGFGRHALFRLRLLRIAAGFDPCWCET